MILLLALCLRAAPAWAVTGESFAYSRTNIVIMRAGMASNAPVPMPWQTDKDIAGSAGVIFDVEIRDAMTLYNQSGWYNLSGPSEKSGVMLVFKDEGIAPITTSAQYAPLDILIIDHEGKVHKIIPNLLLSQLEQDIIPESPVKAFLFLKGGTCQAMGINPGDYVLYKIFKRPPAVLSAPPIAQAPQPTAQQAPPAAPLLKPAQAAAAPMDAAGTPASHFPVSDAPVPEALPSASDAGDGPAQLSAPQDPLKQRRRVNSAPMMIPVQ